MGSIELVDVSVIIVNYHTSGLLADCIESIKKMSYGFSYEVIVVDNDSEPDLENRYASDKDIRVIRLTENLGFGRANNAGFAVARGRYLFCLNPDTLMLNNAIGVLVKFMDSHPEAAACGANLFNARMKPTLSFRRMLPGVLWEINEFLNGKLERATHGNNRFFNHSGSPLEVAYISGADLMVRRKVYDRIGGFAPEFFMYYEETDWCRRIRKNGGKIFSVPQARIQHLEGGSFSSQGANEKRIKRTEDGRRTFYAKNYNIFYRQVINLLTFMTYASRALLVGEKARRDAWRVRLKYFFNH